MFNKINICHLILPSKYITSKFLVMPAKNNRKCLNESGLEDFDESSIQSLKSMELCPVVTTVSGSHHHVTLTSHFFRKIIKSPVKFPAAFHCVINDPSFVKNASLFICSLRQNVCPQQLLYHPGLRRSWTLGTVHICFGSWNCFHLRVKRQEAP
jgi:hypothetical protein